MATGPQTPAVVFRVALSALAIAFASLTASGCSSSGGNVGAVASDKKPPTQSSRTGQRASRLDRKASVYAAVIRRLVTKDHTFGGQDPGFRVVFILDGAVAGVANLNAGGARNPKRPFSEALKRKIKNELSDLPPLRFVRTRDVAIRGESSSSPGHVVPGGVLISLGPIVGGPSKVRVGNSLWLSGLAGQWLTYVLARRGGGWRVKGTTGPMAIS